jgi:hypothetical protein
VHLQFTAVSHGSVAEARRVAWAFHGNAVRAQWKRAPLRILTVGAALSLVFVQADGRDTISIPDVVAILVALILYYALVPLYMIQRVAAARAKGPARTTGTTITDNEIVLDTPNLRVVRWWPAIQSVTDHGDFLVFRGDKGAALFMICAQCAGPGQYAELRMFLVDRGLLPSEYKIKI